MQEPVVRCSSSNSATFELVARWRGSGGSGLYGDKGRTGGVGAGFVLSSWRECENIVREMKSSEAMKSWG